MVRLSRSFSILAVSAAAAAAQGPSLTPCTVGGLEGDVRCGTVRVAENPQQPAGRQIDLFVVVARATGASRVPDPFMLLAGGPGQAGSQMSGFAADAFARVREHRDIVLMDVRGTGRSNSLACSMMRRSSDLVAWTLYPGDAIRLCRDSLSRQADLTMYTTPIVADDIEAVRRAFGWPALNLYGTSYGSRVALSFLRRHPASVRTMVLKAVAPPTMVAPMNYAEDAEAAFHLLERDCRADSACARAFPSPRADLDTVLARAARGELRTVVGAETLAVSRDAIAGVILGAMQSSGSRAHVPFILRATARGESGPLPGFVTQYRRQLDAGIAFGMHLSAACADDGRSLDVTAARSTDAKTYLGSSRVRMLAEACATWPTAAAESAAHAPVRSNAPVLLVSGELDPNTPPRWAEDALRTLPNARHVILRGVAHGWSNVTRCGAEFVADFVRQASVRNLDVSCAERSSAPPFVTSSQ